MLSSFKDIQLSSEREFVLVDNTIESNLPVQGPISRIPLQIWIDYGGKAVNPPMVTFLINPTTLNFSLSKKNNATFTRGGYVVGQWGENLDVLNFNGTIGAYYVLSNSTGNSGLNRYDRSKSASFRNLMEIFLIYQNNGAIYNKTKKLEKLNDKSKKLVENSGYESVKTRVPNSIRSTKTSIALMGDVFLQYDKTLYYGSFDTFTIEEDASKPFTLNYTFSFTVLRRSVTDNRSVAYYNQVALEFSDYITSGKKLDERVIGSYLKTERDSKDQEAKTNPESFTKNVEIINRPAVLLSNVTKILDKDGYSMNSSQKASYSNSFKDLTSGNQTYKESQITKENIYKTTESVIKDNKPNISPEESSSKAREISNNITNQAESMAGK